MRKKARGSGAFGSVYDNRSPVLGNQSEDPIGEGSSSDSLFLIAPYASPHFLSSLKPWFEGHLAHRYARQCAQKFAGKRVVANSPNNRFDQVFTAPYS